MFATEKDEKKVAVTVNASVHSVFSVANFFKEVEDVRDRLHI